MSSFTQFTPPTRQMSDIVAPSQPIQDNSSAIGLGGLVQGVASLADVGFDIYQNQQKKEAAAATSAFTREFDEVLRSASLGIDSGEISSTKARSLITLAKRDLISRGADPLSLDKQEAGNLKTLAGEVLEEGSKQEQAERARWDRFVASKAYDGTKSASANMANFSKWEADEAESYAMAKKVEANNLILSDNSVEKSERERASAENAEIVREQINLAVTNMPDNLQKEISAIVNSAAPQLEKEQALEMLRNRTHASISGIRTQLGGTEYRAEADITTRLADKMVDTAIKYLGNSEANRVMTEELERERLGVAGQLMAIPEVGKVAGLSVVANNLLPLTLSATAKREINKMEINSLTRGPGASSKNDHSTPKDDPAQREKTISSLKAISNGILNLESGKTDALGNPLATAEDLAKMVSDRMVWMHDATNKGTLLAETEGLVDAFANMGLGKFVSENQKLFDATEIANFRSALSSNKVLVADAVNAHVGHLLSEEALLEKAGQGSSPRQRIALKKKTSLEDLEIKAIGQEVRFVGKTPAATRLAEEVNAKVGSVLTTSIKASAEVAGVSVSESLEEVLPRIWPSKYGESPEQDVEEVDYTQYKDGDYQDEEGNIFTIRNGILTETRRADDVTASR